MMTNVNDNEITIEKNLTLGKRLCQAREAKKLTIADIASELRLSKQTIELIENERWSELHGRAYARGYFTNYVKYLGLPEDEFLAAFNIEYTIADPTLSVTRNHVEITNNKFVWLPSLSFIIVLVIGWLAFQQMDNTAEIPMEEASSSFLSTLDNNATTTSSTDDTSKEYENIVPDSQPEMNELDQLVSADTEILVNSEQSKDTSNDISEIVTGTELDTVGLQADLTEEAINNELTPENATVLNSSEAVLDLRFSDDCWAQVRDADNKILLNKLMTKNDSIILKGRTPFTVTLGRASVTQIRFNDQLFDPSAFTQRDVARFTLGAES
jgi:cytoskeleton protein RodZ